MIYTTIIGIFTVVVIVPIATATAIVVGIIWAVCQKNNDISAA